MTNARSMILAGLALTAAALMLVPSVAAQAPTLDVSIAPPAKAVQPEIKSESMSVTVTWNEGNAVQPLAGVQNGQIAITFNPSCPNGIRVVGPAQRFINIATPEANAEYTVTADFQVSAPRSAPGLVGLQCTMGVKASQVMQSTVPAVEEVTSNFEVSVDYYSLNQVKVATKLKQSGPQKQVPFEMEVTNFGNARTSYLFEIGNQPKSTKWNELLPEVLLLDSPNSGQGSNVNTAIFTVATPFKNGWNNDEGSYQILIKPAAADDNTLTGTPLTANVLVRVRGVYVPSLEPLVMLGAILGSALILRLRKAE